MHMSQMELAEKSELSVPYISYIETGKKRVSLNALLHIAKALGTTPNHLLSEYIYHTEDKYSAEFASLLTDCNDTQRKFIRALIHSLKCVFKTNHWFIDN